MPAIRFHRNGLRGVAVAASPVTNLVSDPDPDNVGSKWLLSNWGTGAGTFTYDPAEDAMVSEVTTASTNGAHTFRIGSVGPPGSADVVSVVPGRRYTHSIWVKSSINDGRGMAFDFADAAGNPVASVSTTPGADGSSVLANQFLPAGEWVKFETVGILAPPNAAQASVCIIFSGTPSPGPQIRPVGSKMWFRNAAVYETPRSLPYADGDTPGWRWTGASGNSASTGYFYL